MDIKEEARAKNLEFFISRPIEVDNQPSELVVRAKLDMQNATWKVTTSITTKQVDPSNDQATSGVLKTLGIMIAKMVDKMIEERHHLLQPQEGERGQFTLDFEPVQHQAKKGEEEGERAAG